MRDELQANVVTVAARQRAIYHAGEGVLLVGVRFAFEVSSILSELTLQKSGTNGPKAKNEDRRKYRPGRGMCLCEGGRVVRPFASTGMNSAAWRTLLASSKGWMRSRILVDGGVVPAELLLVGWSSLVTRAMGLGRELLAFNILRGEEAKRRARQGSDKAFCVMSSL